MYKKGGLYLPDDDKYFGKIFEKEGGFQLDRLAKALSYVTSFDLAVDAGAHVGSWTRVMAERFTKVHAFEPVKSTFDCLKENTKEYNNVSTMRCALGSKIGFVDIEWDPRYEAQGNTGSKFVSVNDEFGKTPMIKLDGMNLPALDFLKLDVEGAEYDVLKGAESSVLKYKPVILLEVKKGYARRFEHEDMDVVELVESLGATLVDRINADHIYMFNS